jgi:hypothetical protein
LSRLAEQLFADCCGDGVKIEYLIDPTGEKTLVQSLPPSPRVKRGTKVRARQLALSGEIMTRWV